MKPGFTQDGEYMVTAKKTEQNIQDAYGVLGILSRGLSYDPVEIKYDIKKIAPSNMPDMLSDMSDKSNMSDMPDMPGMSDKTAEDFNRFAPSDSELAFYDKIEAEIKEHNERESNDFEQAFSSSPMNKGKFV